MFSWCICNLGTFWSLNFGDPVDRGRFTRSPSGPSLHSEIGNFVKIEWEFSIFLRNQIFTYSYFDEAVRPQGWLWDFWKFSIYAGILYQKTSLPTPRPLRHDFDNFLKMLKKCQNSHFGGFWHFFEKSIFSWFFFTFWSEIEILLPESWNFWGHDPSPFSPILILRHEFDS